MKTIRKLLRKQTLEVKDQEHLSLIKDHLFKKYDENPLWGYDDTYVNDEIISSGYLHYNKGYFLSKQTFDKPIIEDLKLFDSLAQC